MCLRTWLAIYIIETWGIQLVIFYFVPKIRNQTKEPDRQKSNVSIISDRGYLQALKMEQ